MYLLFAHGEHASNVSGHAHAGSVTIPILVLTAVAAALLTTVILVLSRTAKQENEIASVDEEE